MKKMSHHFLELIKRHQLVHVGRSLLFTWQKKEKKKKKKENLYLDMCKTKQDESFKPLKGNAIGLNMLSSNKKLSENTQNTSLCSGTVRRFPRANAQIAVVKTAAQR